MARRAKAAHQRFARTDTRLAARLLLGGDPSKERRRVLSLGLLRRRGHVRGRKASGELTLVLGTELLD